MNGHRPTPDLAQYTVPGVEGFYLVGPSMHPGAGLTGAGRTTAMRMLQDLDIDFGHPRGMAASERETRRDRECRVVERSHNRPPQRDFTRMQLASVAGTAPPLDPGSSGS